MFAVCHSRWNEADLPDSFIPNYDRTILPLEESPFLLFHAMNPPSLPSRADVIAACDANGPNANGLAYNSEVWIKYGWGVTEAEAILQQFVHMNADPSILYTPAVYDYFARAQDDFLTVTYIVMERVSGPSPTEYIKEHADEADAVFNKIAAAVRHLWELPLPDQASIGPLHGQIPHDWFFSDYGAGRTFNDVDELEGWVNGRLADAGRGGQVDLKPFPRHICHCDLAQHNIIYGDPVIVLDWGMSGVYPRIFDEFALVRQFSTRRAKFVKRLHRQLFGDKLSPVLRPLMAVSNYNAYGIVVARPLE